MKQRSNSPTNDRKGPTFCARVPSRTEGVALGHASIEFAPFEPRQDPHQRQFLRRARHD
jgi:hypothetical protein